HRSAQGGLGCAPDACPQRRRGPPRKDCYSFATGRVLALIDYNAYHRSKDAIGKRSYLQSGGRPMNELSARALDTARSRGATYADVRIVRTQRESIQLKNGTVEALALGEEHGFGVRVIADGAWGFASSSILTLDEVDRVAALAVQIARASARVVRAPVN